MLEENIFAESNALIKSIQVILDTLNELRLCYVMERTSSSFGKDNLMYTKPSSCGPKSRSTSVKTKDFTSTSTAFVISTSSWDKV
ncbi:hypothetical protein RHMOL_Rhmol08G0188900 [Rhododendron molle]|uniref:Uncharacterized protein n=1 Tax=Rhododendron molle TaxID=49168 RepID=A0ACC0MPU6_RHOML|nr:hypothetical protein RHMOL_Rhmol08G0188900 [Rhododendron molle]